MLQQPVDQSFNSPTDVQNGCKYSRMYDSDVDEDTVSLRELHRQDSSRQTSADRRVFRVFRPVILVLFGVTLVILLVLAVVWSVLYFERPPNYRGHKVYKLLPKCADDLNEIIRLEKNFKIEFWNEPYFKEPSEPILIQISPGEQERRVTDELIRMNVNFTVMIEDLHAAIEEEKMSHRSGESDTAFDLSRYHSLAEISDFVEQRLRNAPNAHIDYIGKSFEGRNIPVVIFSKVKPESESPESGGQSKPVILIDSLIHGNEWITGSTSLYIISELLFNESLSDYAERFEWHVIPVLNPDGYEYAWTRDRLWRKTRSLSLESIFCRGADAERNFDTHFYADTDEDRSPCSDYYGGDYPFSEPESVALKNYVERVNQTRVIVAYFSLQSYKQLVLYPYGYTGEPPQNGDQLVRLAGIAADAMRAANGAEYRTASASDTQYTSSGIIIDWMYDRMKVNASFKMDLRDRGHYGHLLPKELILPTGAETLAGIKAVVDAL